MFGKQAAFKKLIRNEKLLAKLILTEIVISILLIMASGYLFKKQHEAQENLIAAGQTHYNSYLLADRLRQSSDDLTRMVRTYAATGNPVFEKYFWEILDIRNGKKARPLNYERVFWDFMTVNTPEPPFAYGLKRSLDDQMKDAGFTEQEMQLLDLSHQISDSLVYLENIAMNAMKGKFQDENGNFTISGPPDREMAINILFGEKYHEAKKQIMKPINQFYEAINQRTSRNIEIANSYANRFQLIFVFVFGLLIISGFFLFWTSFVYQKLLTSRLKETIDELLYSNTKFENEKERLSITLRSIGDGVITTDIHGKIILINRVTEKLTGWSQSEAVGRPLQEVFNIIDEKSGKPCNNPGIQVLETGQVVELAESTVLIARDGTQFSIKDSAAPIFDTGSKIIGVVLVFRDVTRERKTEKELLKVKKLESVGVLAGGIAHDFNNILAAILGNIELAKDNTEPTNEAYGLLAEAQKASIRAKALTQQLLTFSKGGEPVKQTSSIGKTIIDSANFILHGSSVICNYNIPDDLWLADVDTGQISQVIQNIIINARDAMPKGGVIKISGENIHSLQEKNVVLPAEKYIKITIVDSGKGIPAKYIDKIFDPYFSTKKMGSGLGLAICHSIIRKHDGRIFVQSEKNVGTTFTIYLPAAGTHTLNHPPESAPLKAQRKATIMVMDDESMVRNMVKKMLTRSGYDVVLVKNGHEAIKKYNECLSSECAIDMVIMDLTIPGSLGGKDTASEILKLNQQAKLVVASGYSNDPVMAHYQDYGFVASITKPFQWSELSKVVSEVLL